MCRKQLYLVQNYLDYNKRVGLGHNLAQTYSNDAYSLQR